MLLTDKVAIVTGASRGIGCYIALDLAKEGAKVIVNYNSNADAAEEVVKTINSNGGTAIAVRADVSDFAQAQTLVNTTTEAYGQVDILVNNAGTTRDTLLMVMKEEQWDTVINTNLKSMFNCCKAVLKPMLRRKKGGRIINISSVVALRGQGGQTNYSASKAGIIGFTKSLAKEVAARNVTVNAIAPGFFPTALTDVLSNEQKEKAMEFIPLGRFGNLPDVGYLVSFLASDKASYITGDVIRVDGGIGI